MYRGGGREYVFIIIVIIIIMYITCTVCVRIYNITYYIIVYRGITRFADRVFASADNQRRALIFEFPRAYSGGAAVRGLAGRVKRRLLLLCPRAFVRRAAQQVGT